MLAIGVSAATLPEYGEVESVEGIALSDKMGSGVATDKSALARVKLSCTCEAGSHTFPTYYIMEDASVYTEWGATTSYLSYADLNAIGASCGNKSFSHANIIAIEIPDGVINLGSGLYWDGSSFEKNIELVDLSTATTLKKMNATMSGKNWWGGSTKLKEVRFPASLENIETYTFYDCTALENIVIPKDSVIKSIGRYSFSGCTSLGGVYLPKTLESLGAESGAFEGCKTMWLKNSPDETEKPSIYYFPETLNSLSGEIFKSCANLNETLVFGSNLTTIPDGWAFQGTGVKNMVFTADMTTVGYALVGANFYFANPADKSTDDVTLTKSWNNGSVSVNPFFCASESNLANHIENPRGKETIDATCYSLEKVTTKCFCTKLLSEAETPNSMIDHEYIDNFDCTKGNQCKNFAHCNASLDAEALEHIEKHAVAYADGFAKSGLHTVWCDNEGCKALDNEITLGAMISTSGGYSVNGNGGLAGGWTVDTDLVTLFNDYNEKDVQFGIFMVNPSHLASEKFMTGYMPNLADGKSGALVVEMTGTEHSNFAFQISGFNSDELEKLELVITAYAYVEGEDVEYIQDADTVCKVTTLDYADGSLYTVTYEKASSELSPVSVEAVIPTIKKDNF